MDKSKISITQSFNTSGQDERAKKQWDFYETYKDNSSSWREGRNRNFHFVTGQQYSDTEAQEAEDLGELDVVINLIGPMIRATVNQMIAGSPTGVVYGERVSDAHQAALLNDWLMWHWEKSKGKYVAEKVVTRQNRDGIGYYYVYLDPFLDHGRGELVIGHLPYNNVFVDKGAGNTWDWSDAPRILVSKLVRIEDFYLQNPSLKQDASLQIEYDEIVWSGKSMDGREYEIGVPQNVDNPQQHMAGTGRWVRPIDTYEKRILDTKTLVHKLSGKVIKEILKTDDWSKEEKDLIAKSKGRSVGEDLAVEEKDSQAYRYALIKTVSGKKFLSERILPIPYCPVVPVIDNDVDNTLPLGEVDAQEGLQRLLNSSMKLVLLNAALSSSGKTYYDPARSGLAKDDADTLAAKASVPGVWIPAEIDPQLGDFPIKEVKPEPLNQAFFTLVNFFASQMQIQNSVIQSRISGSAKDVPEAYSSFEKMDKDSQEGLTIRVNRHELAIQRVFEIILFWTPHHYKFEKFFEYTKPDDTVVRGTVNQKVPAQSRAQDNGETTVVAWKTMNDITSFYANFRIRRGSTTQSETIKESHFLMQLLNGNPAILKHIINRLPMFTMEEKRAILEDVDLVNRLQQQVKQLSQQMKVMVGELQRKDQQLTEAAKGKHIKDFQLKLEQILMEEKQKKEKSSDEKN